MWASEQTRLQYGILCMQRARNIGILGGTFNPPHIGHLTIAEKVYHEFSLDKILLMPSGTPPHKMGDRVLDREIRKSMTELLAEERPFLELCTLELEREGTTFTVDTMHTMRSALPNANLYFIIGTDTLFELPTWKNCEEVFAITTFICVARPGDIMEDVRRTIDEYRKKYRGRVLLSGNVGPDISSTQIREMIEAGLSVKGLVTDKVLEFMEQNHVFRER